jgi:hypothetical protein
MVGIATDSVVHVSLLVVESGGYRWHWQLEWHLV